MLVNAHYSGKKLLLALCDDTLIGNVFEEGNKMLDLSGNFYKGNKIAQAELEELLKKAYLISAVGSSCVKMLVDRGLADRKDAIKIKGIEHVQVLIES